MGLVTKVNGLKNTAGVLYENNCKLFIVQVKNSGGSNIDLRSESDAFGEAVEAVVNELSPLAFFVVNSGIGLLYVVMDVHVSAPGMQTRIRNLGRDVGPNSVDVTGTVVTPATALQLS